VHALDEDAQVEPDWDRLVSGVLLVGLGVVWVLSSTDVVDPNWRVLLPVALIAVGATAIVLAMRGRGVRLVGTGTLLTVLVVVSALLPANVGWRVGDQEVRPTRLDELDARYSHGVGTLTIDLRDLELETSLELESSNGIGETIVRVPPDAALEVDARAGVGSIEVGGRTAEGVNASLDLRIPGDGPTIRLDLSTGVGEIRVER
jgi:predicted membrane protein